MGVQMGIHLLVLLLLSLSHAQTDYEAVRSDYISLKEAEINVITFTCGTIDMKTGNPILYYEPFRYSFEGLPKWLSGQNNKIVGVPPTGQSGWTTIKVKYEGLKSDIRGQFEYKVAYGGEKPMLPVGSKILTYLKAEVRFNKTLNAPSSQGHYVMLVPYLLPSEVKKLEESRNKGQQVAEKATEKAQNSNNVLANKIVITAITPITLSVPQKLPDFQFDCQAIDFISNDKIIKITQKFIQLSRNRTLLLGPCTQILPCKSKNSLQLGQTVSYQGRKDANIIHAKSVRCLK